VNVTVLLEHSNESNNKNIYEFVLIASKLKKEQSNDLYLGGRQQEKNAKFEQPEKNMRIHRYTPENSKSRL
jgi:hypothetical protein